MLGVGDVVGRIATDKHVIGINALGQIELLLCHLWLKMAYPARSQALLGGLHHHLIANDGCIDFAGIHLIIRAHPSIIGNAANKEDKRSAKEDPQAAAAGGLPSETDGLGRKESGFGNGQQDRGVGSISRDSVTKIVSI